MNRRYKNQGFTLIEVMVALVILAVGLLGVAALTMTSLQSNQSAYQRSQASLLAYDIIERMRSNQLQAAATTSYSLTKNATATSTPGCVSSGCNAAQQAQLDLSQWRAALVSSIPGATASITPTLGTGMAAYEITIYWDDAGASLKKADGTTITPSFSLRVDL